MLWKFLIFIEIFSSISANNALFQQVFSGGDEICNKSVEIGRTGNLGQYPYHVVILSKKKDGYVWDFCGGTIIHKHWILTSGFCLFIHDRVRVYGGVINREKLNEAEYMSGDIYEESFKIHPNYRYRYHKFNIGLINVCEGIRSSKLVAITNLPLRNDFIDEGMIAQLSGFGGIREGHLNNQIEGLTKQIDNNGLCEENFSEHVFDQEQHLCLKPDSEGSACISDNGGEAIITINGRQAVYGIFNYYSAIGCDKNYPEVYTKVQAFLDWIYEETKIDENSTKIPEISQHPVHLQSQVHVQPSPFDSFFSSLMSLKPQPKMVLAQPNMLMVKKTNLGNSEATEESTETQVEVTEAPKEEVKQDGAVEEEEKSENQEEGIQRKRF